MTGIDDSNVNLNRCAPERTEPPNPYVVSLVWIASVSGGVGWILAIAGAVRAGKGLISSEETAAAPPLWIVGGALFAAAFVAAVAALLLSGARWLIREATASVMAGAHAEHEPKVP